MSDHSDDRQAEKMIQQSEKLIVIETKLDGIANTLNLSLMHLKDTVDRNHKETTADLDHAKAAMKSNHQAIEKLLDKKLDRLELDAHAKEGNDRYASVLASIEKKADNKEFALVQKLVFGFVALVLVAVVGAVIALVVLKPEPRHAPASAAVSQPVQPQDTAPKPTPAGPL